MIAVGQQDMNDISWSFNYPIIRLFDLPRTSTTFFPRVQTNRTMEGNKDEAARCIELAEKYIKEKNRDKAERFLHKAEKLYPTQKAKGTEGNIKLQCTV